MKVIVDAQLPISLSVFLNENKCDSIHTLQLPNRNASQDYEIRVVAKKQNRIVVTKDNDFLESYIINKEPKKLLLISTGNITNSDLINIFKNNLIKFNKLF